MSVKAQDGQPNVEVYKKLFLEADVNRDGFLTIQEFAKFYSGKCGSHMSDSQIADTFVFFDGPMGDKKITLEEFSKGLDEICAYVKKLIALFAEYDKSKDGFLDKGELKKLLLLSGKKITDEDVNNIVKSADKNNDNRISLKEFLDACT